MPKSGCKKFQIGLGLFIMVEGVEFEVDGVDITIKLYKTVYEAVYKIVYETLFNS